MRAAILLFICVAMRSGGVAGDAAASSATVVDIPRLGIETHSFNDINIWPQMIRMNVRWIKVDIGYCTRDSCVGYSTFNLTSSVDNCFNQTVNSNTTVELCCLCMRGDASTRPYLISPFNTTDDLINFFNSSANQVFLPHRSDEPPPERDLMMGFDFGGVSVDLTQGQSAQLVANFLLTLYAVLQNRDLAVTPYFDATFNSLFQNLDMLCSRNACTPFEQQLQSLPWPSENGEGTRLRTYSLHTIYTQMSVCVQKRRIIHRCWYRILRRPCCRRQLATAITRSLSALQSIEL
jgi:hypothetical protein